jgi:threonine synthase
MKAGQIVKLPRLFVAQPLNCSPIDASFQAGVDTPVPREVHKTIAEGTAIKRPMRLREIISALRESGGGTIALTEEEIVAALRRLARQGLFAEPTCASAAAALDKLSSAGIIKAGESTVVIVTGTGLKAASTVADLVQ